MYAGDFNINSIDWNYNSTVGNDLLMQIPIMNIYFLNFYHTII